MSVQYTGGVQYNGGCSVHWGYHEFSGGYHEYTGGVQYTGRYHEYTGGYHDKCGGRSLGKQLNLYGNPSVLNIPRCTHDIPHSHHGIPQYTHGIPQGTEHPRCTHDIPTLLMIFTPPPSVLNDILQCIEHPPVYCIDIMQGENY